MKKINEIIEQAVNGLGYEFVDLELTPLKIIRVFIDKDGGVNIEDCELVSDHLNKLLIVEDIDYSRLEISSPGLERPLKKFADFERFIGREVRLKTNEMIDNEKVFYGVIESCDSSIGDIKLKLLDKPKDPVSIIINFNNINKARLVFEYKKSLKHKKIKG